jgi:peptidoglycan hydrolase-like protein with peptidoglycan-binding domain
MRSFAVAGLLFFALVLPAHADFDSALASYERGDYGPAFGEFRALAEGGDGDAQYMLGYLYGVGRGTPQSYVDAHKWFNLAASRGRPGAVEARDDVARLMTPEQIAEAQRQARAWRPTTAAAAQSPQWAPPEEAGGSYVAAPSRETVARIQRLLAELGYAPGATDGVAGAQTEQAIRRYQADVGLPVDGRPSEALRAHLAAAAEQRRAAAPAASAMTRAPGAADRSQELVDDILALAERGERAGAAQPWFLAEVRALARRYHWPWRAEVLRDDFRDGNFTANPAWTVVAGNFGVDANLGLKTVVTAQQATAAERQPEDLATAILGTILERATGSEGARAQTTAQSYSQIYVGRAIPNAFALELQLTSRAESGRFEFGPYQGGERASGYRLAYSPGVRPSLELVRLSPFGGSVIEAHQEALELEDGRVHTVLWTRDESGVMVVTVDGEELLRAGDRGVAGPFDGVVFINRGGDYTVREIKVYGAGTAPR